MSDGNKLLSDCNCRYGAPMGRMCVKNALNSKVRLFKVRLDQGGYDRGGAYWGFGQRLYAALGDDFAYYLRAKDRGSARQALLEKFPGLRFYR